MKTLLKIAIDSNAAKTLMEHYGADVYERVAQQSWQVYLPVIVYAEQAVWKGHAVMAIVDGLQAQVVSLHQGHADELGRMWDRLRAAPRRGETPQELWRRHKCDWLIAAMVKHEGWLLVSDDTDFQRIKDDVGLQVIKLDEFIKSYLSAA